MLDTRVKSTVLEWKRCILSFVAHSVEWIVVAGSIQSSKMKKKPSNATKRLPAPLLLICGTRSNAK